MIYFDYCIDFNSRLTISFTSSACVNTIMWPPCFMWMGSLMFRKGMVLSFSPWMKDIFNFEHDWWHF